MNGVNRPQAVARRGLIAKSLSLVVKPQQVTAAALMGNRQSLPFTGQLPLFDHHVLFITPNCGLSPYC